MPTTHNSSTKQRKFFRSKLFWILSGVFIISIVLAIALGVSSGLGDRREQEVIIQNDASTYLLPEAITERFIAVDTTLPSASFTRGLKDYNFFKLESYDGEPCSQYQEAMEILSGAESLASGAMWVSNPEQTERLLVEQEILSFRDESDAEEFLDTLAAGYANPKCDRSSAADKFTYTYEESRKVSELPDSIGEVHLFSSIEKSPNYPGLDDVRHLLIQRAGRFISVLKNIDLSTEMQKDFALELLGNFEMVPDDLN
jgi:hypothetical protein